MPVTYTTGKLAESTVVHIVNEHGIMNCLGFGVDEIDVALAAQDACRLCYGQVLNITSPRAKVAR